MSGHSKWSTIKHKKGAADQKRGTLFTKLSREITIAARSGDADPAMNFRLRLAVENAKAQNMPKDNIERAIKRAKGTGEGDLLAEATYEVYGPGGTAILVDVLTNNKNRSVSAVRAAVTRNGGTMAGTGSVAWNFSRKGSIAVKADSVDPEDAALQIMDAGAEDVEVNGNAIEVTVADTDFATARDAIEKIEGISIESAELVMAPNSLIEMEPKLAKQSLRLLSTLEDLEDVQKVFSNADFPDEVLAEFAAES